MSHSIAQKIRQGDKFAHIHNPLADKYKTTPEIIAYIRLSLIPKYFNNRQELISHSLHRKARSTKYKDKWDSRLKFLLNHSDKDIKDICYQATKATAPVSHNPTERVETDTGSRNSQLSHLILV